MTHADIYEKIMIEYDKANIASSYPSLTPYEFATILDKAYLALINLKFTGNNPRKVPFEYDSKAIEDLRPLIDTSIVTSKSYTYKSENEKIYNIPNGMLYYIQSRLDKIIDNTRTVISDVKLITHEMSNKFRKTEYNNPWIKIPVCYLESDSIHLLYDKSIIDFTNDIKLIVTYIKSPTKFVKSTESDLFSSNTLFELSNSMAEELINLAIIMALESVESPRINTKSSLISLES